MGHTAHSKETIDVETYLRGELTSEVRHEYVGGRLYALVGCSDSHNLIAMNLGSALHQHLRGDPCQVFMSDMKVRLRIASEDVLYYPDLLVSCDPLDRARYWREQPCLVVEIASETTARIDRREKLLAYREPAPSPGRETSLEKDMLSPSRKGAKRSTPLTGFSFATFATFAPWREPFSSDHPLCCRDAGIR